MAIETQKLALYLVTDPDLCAKFGLIETVKAAVLGGVSIVQLRDKNASTAQMIQHAKELQPILATHNVPLIINDDVEAAIAEFGAKARDKKLTIEDMTGGTFTVSNGGVFGSLLSTPILNPPQTGILGMHTIQERPIAMNGEVVIQPMMYLALSYDHRLVDGKTAVQFLVTIKGLIEDPARILLQL